MRFGPTLMAQADALARFTADPPGITRTYLSPEHKAAGDYLIGLMHEAGMAAGFDALGNIVGRYAATDPDAPVVMTGSHQDSVRNAGKYDGLFGILTAIACVRDLHQRGKRLPYALEVIGFGDEEGVRFAATLIGSKAMAGAFDPAWLARKDTQDATLRQALVAFGGDPDAIASLDRRNRRVAAFVESHIEQGPVLLNEGLALGVVTAIAGATRLRINVTGLAGHAGTVPMGQRQDALAAASEMVLAIEGYCEAHRDEGGLVGTVGILEVKPGAANVIPQDVTFTIDVRSGDDQARRAAIAAIDMQLATIAARRKVAITSQIFYEADAAPCHPGLQAQLADAIRAQEMAVRHLPSGAGHDAMVFPQVCPTAMLFVRCGNNGISHHPDEIMSVEDAEAATAALLYFSSTFSRSRERRFNRGGSMASNVGGVSIHVVDVSRGLVATGMQVDVLACGAQRRLVASGTINGKGVLDEPALMSDAMQPGTYEAVFHVADYYRAAGIALPTLPFLDVVTYRFAVNDALAHYHLPMKVTPWGYSCFRGGA